MSEAHRKKKQPEQVRRDLLDCTANIAAEFGFAKLTIEAVSKAVGVTKGGLLHHFPNKRALIDAMVVDMLDQTDQYIDAYMAKDATVKGRFTRAYVAMTLNEENFNPLDPGCGIGMAMLADPESMEHCLNWLSKRIALHKETDSDPLLEIIRFAADGAWMNFTAKRNAESVKQAQLIRKRLIDLTLTL